MNAYAVLILYDNDIVHIETHVTQKNADDRAVSLANEWYKEDGIIASGKYRLETIEEVREYHRSSAYYDNGDFIHVCVKEIDSLRRMK